MTKKETTQHLNDRPTICLVKDNLVLRKNLEMFFLRAGFDVVGSFPSGEKTLEFLAKSSCDYVLVDLELPGMSGVALIERIRLLYPDITLVVNTVYDDRESVFAALQAGALGYMLKGSSEAELLHALDIMKSGGSPMSASVARKVIEALHRPQKSEDEKNLSVRELKVLQQISQGFQAKEIAEQLHLSVHTVYSHLKNIYGKLQVRTKNEAVKKASRIGLFH